MQISTLSIATILILLCTIFVIYKNNTEKLTTKSYITTVYLYILCAFLLIILINDQKFLLIDSSIKYVALAFLAIILVIALSFIPKEQQLIKHLVWIALIGIFALFLSPIILAAQYQNILGKVLLTVTVMFIIMTYFAYNKPIGFLDSWQPYFYAGLIAIIVLSLANIIFSNLNSSGFDARTLIISAIIIFLFNGFLFFDTQQLIKDGRILEQTCGNESNFVCADYPTSSLNIFLDLLNLFTATTDVYSR